MPSELRNRRRTIPVIVDDVSEAGDGQRLVEPLIRCVCFSIDAAEPNPHWILTLDKLEIPYFMLSLTGIIYAPVESDANRDRHEFLTIDDIDKTFATIEGHPALSIETASIFLPQNVLTKLLNGEPPRVRSVLRMREDLFVDAFSFARQKSSTEEFHRQLSEYLQEPSGSDVRPVRPLYFSDAESKAFQQWSDHEIDLARQQYLSWQDAGQVGSANQNPNDHF